MRCGEDGAECAISHVVPELGGRCTQSRKIGSRIIPYEWACTCPACSTPGKLTLTAKGRNLLRFCQKCNASQAALTTALAERLPGCFYPDGLVPSQRRAPRIEAGDVIELALADMPPQSKMLAFLELAGLSTPDALDKLGVRRENRPRVIAARVRGRRR